MATQTTFISLKNTKAEEVLKKILSDKEAVFNKNRTPEAIAKIRSMLAKKGK